jgi:hypothetical protein
MKLFSVFNHVFSTGYSLSDSQSTKLRQLWNLVRTDESLNGFYIALPEYITESHIGALSPTNNIVRTWYNLLADGNYLYSSDNSSSPSIVTNDTQFNNYPSLNFDDSSLQQLFYKFPVSVGTIIIVYLTRQSDSYLIYAPRNTPSPSVLFYDAFPRTGNALWSNELYTGSSIYNATSRINSRVVTPSTFVPLNRVRVLTVKNISNPEQKEVIQGYGGKSGELGGAENKSIRQSVQGKIAAIITFENDIDNTLTQQIETLLVEMYINYQGIVATATPAFKVLVDAAFSYDFSTILLDEFFDIASYELLTPLDMGLSFTGSVLSGSITTPYEGTIKIAVTNSASMTSTFEFSLKVCRPDPIVALLPKQTNITLALSAENSPIDSSFYGITKDSSNRVTRWEDARRVTNAGVTNNEVNYLLATTGFEPNWLDAVSLFNSHDAVQFNAIQKLDLAAGVSGKTFVWVYIQDSYGTRPMLKDFSDIKGEGQLWTVSTISQIHGQTPITKLTTRSNKVLVNTLNYKLDLNRLYIITAVQPDDVAISFSGLEKLRGKLAFFTSWNIKLSDSELNTVVSVLANRYFSSLAPYVFSTETEYRFLSNITIDLTKKVVDLQSLPLTYELLTPIYDAAIDSNGILSFTGERDEILTFAVKATNTIPLDSTFNFDVDITLRTNPLYLNLKSLLGTNSFTLILLPDLDTLTLSSTNITHWSDYRLNTNEYIGHDVILSTLPSLNNKSVAEFDIDGSSYLEGSTTISGKGFIVGYVRKESSIDRAFLFGQASTNDFSSGNNGILFDSGITATSILSSHKYVNGKEVTNSYLLKPKVLNTIVFNSSSTLSFNSIAKDRLFNDRSVKGYIGCVLVLNRNITFDEAVQINTYIRDYYDPARYVTLLHFDSVITDSSPANKTLTTNASVSTSIKKFGASSLILTANSICKYIEIPNETDYAFLNEDFTISFWLNVNKALSTGDIQSLYSQSDLQIYLKGSSLYIGRNNIPEAALFFSILSNTFFNSSGVFHHIEITKSNGILYYFIDGVLGNAIADTLEYSDYNSPILLGQRTNLLNTTGYNCYLDELLVYRRTALHTSSFTPPSSPYI